MGEVIDERRHNFFCLDNEVIEIYGREMGPLGIAVYATLVKHAERGSRTCYPSYKTIADLIGVSRNTAMAGVRKLVSLKLIRVEKREDADGLHDSNLFRLMPVPKTAKESDKVVQILHHQTKEVIELSDGGGADIVPRVVQNLHRGGADIAPEQDPSNKTQFNKKEKDSVERPTARSPVRQVFDYWQEKTGHVKAKLTPERDRIIRLRLKDYTPEELMRAVDGCLVSPFHMGDNDRHTRYDFVKTIFRDGEQVEKFIAFAEVKANGKPKQARAAPYVCTLCDGSGSAIRFNSKTQDDEEVPCKCQPTTQTPQRPATTHSAARR